MFNKQRVPVTLFSSTDEGAPRFSSKAGDIFKIVKACLVNGYGSKQSLGWELKFESGNQGIFMPTDIKHTGWGLSFGTDTGSVIKLDAVKNPTSLTANEQDAKLEFLNKFTYQFSGGNTSDFSWKLIGHSLGFILLLTSKKAYYGKSVILYFGRVPSLAAADDNNYYVIASASSGNYLDQGDLRNRNGFIRDYKGDLAKACNFASKSLMYYSNTVYPSKIINGFFADDVYITEWTDGSNYSLRGYLSGIMAISEDSQELVRGEPYKNLDGSDDQYLCFNIINGGIYQEGGYAKRPVNILVNITAWEV
jgi:hypothetical protein